MKNDEKELNKKLLEDYQEMNEADRIKLKEDFANREKQKVSKMKMEKDNELGETNIVEPPQKEMEGLIAAEEEMFLDEDEGEMEEEEGEGEGKPKGKRRMPQLTPEQMKQIEEFQKRYGEEYRNFKEDVRNIFQIDNPIGWEFNMIKELWMRRHRRNEKFLLELHLTNLNPKITVDILKKIFELQPSIKLFIQGEEILRPGVLKSEGDYFYEGVDNYLFMFSQSKKIQYQGQVLNFAPHGKGIEICFLPTRDGYQYQGEFEQGKKHGKGHMKDNKGVIYNGQFVDNMKHGQGQEVVFGQKKKKLKPGEQAPPKVKNSYKGAFKAGFREGEGTEVTNHGTYEGEWKENLKHGQGSMKYKNEDYYKGNWDKGEFSGQGEYYEKDNSTYNGQFLNGRYHGNGTMTYTNGDKYEGQYEFGKKHGNGKYDWSDGDYYDGEWKLDSAEGHGTSMIGEDFFDGEFKNGKKHGEGELTTGEGDIIRGIWENNELKKKLEVNGEPVEDEEDDK